MVGKRGDQPRLRPELPVAGDRGFEERAARHLAEQPGEPARKLEGGRRSAMPRQRAHELVHGDGPVVDDMPEAAPSAPDGRHEGRSRILDVDERLRGLALAEDGEEPPAKESPERHHVRRLRAVEHPAAKRGTREPELRRGLTSDLLAFERGAGPPDAVGRARLIEGTTLRIVGHPHDALLRVGSCSRPSCGAREAPRPVDPNAIGLRVARPASRQTEGDGRGGMNHRVASLDRPSERLFIEERPASRLDPEPSEHGLVLGPTAEPDDRRARAPKELRNAPPDLPRRSGDEHPHWLGYLYPVASAGFPAS